MVRTILAVMLCVVFISVVEAQAQQSLNLMPLPAKVQTGNWPASDRSEIFGLDRRSSRGAAGSRS